MTPLSDAARARIREHVDRVLTREEVRAYLEAPISAAEREDVGRLIDWFQRRYPTAPERLAYARRASARWRAVPAG